MKDFEKIGGTVAISGICLAALAQALHQRQLGLIGLAGLGLGVILWGISGIIEARMIFFELGVRYRQSYYGLAARAWGAIMCIAGLLMVGFSLFLLWNPNAPIEQVFASPFNVSIGMLLGGLIGMLYATTLILGRAEASSSWWQKALRLPGRLFGVLILLASIALTVAGAVRIVSPPIYEEVRQNITTHLYRVLQLREN